MRKSEWFIVIDTETANSIQYPLPYDIGYKIMNRKGEIAERHSFCIYDIYVGEREMMKSAYYADKLPQYEEELARGERKLVTFRTVKRIIKEECEKYNITKAYAYNAHFDNRALHNLTKHYNSRWWFFFPITVEFHCIWNMACQVLMARPSYIKFALENNFVSEKGNIKTNAECCYRYLIKDPSFKEAHKGIDDVNIEAEILLKCFAQHKKMNTAPYSACWRLVQKKRAEIKTSAPKQLKLTEEEKEKLELCKQYIYKISCYFSSATHTKYGYLVLDILEECPKLQKYIIYDPKRRAWEDKLTIAEGA